MYGVDWAPDGRRIVFAARDSIYIYSVESGEVESLWGKGVPSLHGIGVLTWSPGRDRIDYDIGNPAYILGNLNAAPCEIRVVEFASGIRTTLVAGDVEQLTFTEHGEFWPQWSPDGTRLLYYGLEEGNRDRGMGRVYILSNWEGENREPIGTPLTEVLVRGGAQGEWTKDGQRIVFCGHSDIVLYHVKSAASWSLRAEESGLSWPRGPHWSDNGRQIYVIAEASGRTGLCRLKNRSSTPELVWQFGVQERHSRAETCFGASTMYLARKDFSADIWILSAAAP